jgi:hypothetical protein
VRIAKDLTNSQKKALVARSKIDLNKMCANHPELTHHEIEINIIKERMRNLVPPAANGDQWLMHPFSDMSEPEKQFATLPILAIWKRITWQRFIEKLV